MNTSISRSGQFEELVQSITKLHENISSIGDVGTEIVITRRCADVCKITHLLRACGPNISVCSLDAFDRQLNLSVDNILGSPIGLYGQQQTSLGVSNSGLRFRRTKNVALLVFIITRTAEKIIKTFVGTSPNEVTIDWKKRSVFHGTIELFDQKTDDQKGTFLGTCSSLVLP